MKQILLPFAALMAGSPFLLAPSALAGTVENKPEPAPTAKHSFLDPIGDFVNDDILKPVAPFELVPGKDPNGWSFVVEPYLWAMGLEGTTGVTGAPALNIHYSSKKILQQLNWGVMGMAEVRKGRWGILADGLFASLSGSSDLGGVLYKSGSLNIQQGLASLALAYRVIDDRRGFLDLYAGARYNYLGLQADLTTDSDGILEVSEDITNKIQGRVDAKLSEILSANKGILASRLAELASAVFTNRVVDNIVGQPREIRESLRPEVIRRMLRDAAPALREYITAQAAAKVAATTGTLTSAIQSRVNSARKKLTSQLAQNIENALPTSVSGDRWWIDPIIGLRGQVNFTRWLYFTTQADVGGFGAGSQLTWNVLAAVGFNFTRNIFSEVGYRYMYIDYEGDNFLYQMNQAGLFASLGVKF